MTCKDCGKSSNYDMWAIGPKYPAVWNTETTAVWLCGPDILRRMARLASA